jgi:transposase
MSKIPQEHSAQIRAAYQLSKVRGKELLKLFPQYSKAAVYKHAKKPLNGDPVFDKRKLNKGRPKKLSIQDERRILRTVPKLRMEVGNFTSKRVQLESGITNVCNRTVRNILNKEGYRYLRSRKKGLLHAKDLKARKKFCQTVRRKKLTQDFWKNGIAFYLDGKGFEYKTNPNDQARSPSARIWRKRGEGLNFKCTAKGKKEGGTFVNFMIGIAYGKGVVICERWLGTITGEKFAAIVKRCFRKAFQKSANPKGKLFLMDGCPRQNSKAAMRAIAEVGAKVFKIPARSPDLNPIENFFNIATMKLHNDAIEKQITKENMYIDEFSARVTKTMKSFSSSEIDKIIDSMDKRITKVLKGKGQRTKY